MTLMMPKAGAAAAEPLDAVAAAARGERARWAERRRGIERGRRSIGPDGPRSRWPNRLFGHAIRVFDWGMRGLGLHARGQRNALDPQLLEFELFFPHLPAAFDGYRILHVSDTHFDFLPALAGSARRLLAGVQVDLLVVTGDVQGDPRAPLERSVAPLAEILAAVEVRDRRLAVLGNHDPADIVTALEAFGLEVLINQSTALERQGERVAITGLDDVHSHYTEAARQALLTGAGDFRILLVHSAEMADHAAAAGYALYLCGHTHGGQVCLPGGRPIVTMLRRCRHGASGLWREGAMVGYTSRGLGTGAAALRYNCRGDAAVITLRRSTGAGTARR
ncbi:MAG: metallophosphoesterase [Stellaceae bacterium]